MGHYYRLYLIMIQTISIIRNDEVYLKICHNTLQPAMLPTNSAQHFGQLQQQLEHKSGTATGITNAVTFKRQYTKLRKTLSQELRCATLCGQQHSMPLANEMLYQWHASGGVPQPPV